MVPGVNNSEQHGVDVAEKGRAILSKYYPDQLHDNPFLYFLDVAFANRDREHHDLDQCTENELNCARNCKKCNPCSWFIIENRVEPFLGFAIGSDEVGSDL